MKFVLISISFCLFSINNLLAQIKATTELGDEVMLYHDHTWSYLSEKNLNENEIPNKNKKLFTKSKSADLLVKSKKDNFGVWLDTEKWRYKNSTSNPSAEFEFSSKTAEAFALMISEESEIPLLTLRHFAIENAKKVATNFKVSEQEIRNVNGFDVLMIQMDGTVNKMKISYLGYYFSNEKGNVQLLAYCAKNLFNKNRTLIEEFLNGFVSIE
jgi:hypothetical protein